MVKQLCVILIVLATVQFTYSAKILGLFGTPGRSHFMVYEALMIKLAENGHNVTVVSGFPPSDPVPEAYRHIHVPLNTQKYENISKSLMKVAEANQLPFKLFLTFFSDLEERNAEVFNHPDFLRLKETESFDLVIFGWFVNDYQIGVAAHFKCPAVYIFLQKPTYISRRYVGVPNGVSYNPSTFYYVEGNMNFLQRVNNFIFTGMEYLLINGIDYFLMRSIYEKHFPLDQYPSYEEAKLNVSLVLNNYHFTQGSMEAYLPAMVEVGGMNIPAEPSPLPQDIKEFIDTAPHGAIFFSLGSNARSSHLSEERINTILRVLSKLKERVLWKYEDDTLPFIPENVLIRKWFPQSDILAHPNIKVFISHGGYGSITEAKFHSVPILGLPVFGDQTRNIKEIAKEGWAVARSIPDLTEENFSTGLDEILNNQTYRQTVQKMSKLFRDRPQHPIDTATYWVEYVLRHNGAKHMQSPAVHLNFFQYHSLDVIGFLVLSLYVFVKIGIFMIKFLFKICKSKLKRKID